MKRKLQLREIKNSSNIKMVESDLQDRKGSKLLLPPIKLTLDNQSKKTLRSLLHNMQSFAHLYPGDVSNLLIEFLDTVSTKFPQFASVANKAKPQYLLQKYSNSPGKHLHSRNLQNVFEGAHSQVLSVKKEDLKKVQSRKLFDIMRSAKYDETIMNSDIEMIAALKKQLSQKEQFIFNLNKKIEEFSLKNQQQKILNRSNLKVLPNEQKNSHLVKQNAELNETVDKLQRSLNENKKKYDARLKQIMSSQKQMKEVLEERQCELVSLWQINLSK